MTSSCRLLLSLTDISQKMKFSIKDFFSNCDQIRTFLWIWSHLLRKLMETSFLCSVRALRPKCYIQLSKLHMTETYKDPILIHYHASLSRLIY